MSANSITEKDGRNDSYYVQAASPDTPPAQPMMQPYQRTYGNPAPLGMLAYGTVFLCSSILTLHAGNVTTPNLVLVFATFYGGISQTLVGMWEMFLGNTFSATVFTTYGGFNFSYGALYLPQMGLAAAYTVDGVVGEEFSHAIGIYLGIWALITFVFCLGAIRTTAPIVVTLFFTVCALSCLSASSFTGNAHLNTAGGALGIVASFGAYYGALSLFWTQQTTFSYIRLPPLILAPSNV
ncbi:hypothetical protein SERLA73DRAFT_79899 [Serpula lacrymans var. lacrymans S7.3]|uniref:Uncharacterized protein n=2 Tax=Serpula lacrymans var. lacrymans TaxID=341189 RepID=F8QHZ6_SERL3|nr:uncharacterized protein SERLADRAFT_459650 [Serpula lacrymans var. lacrymans S7.9]EGN92059.1 hypothetical protein SERLA73DRAFT_79899 [Serpula lacrymans var. lacrymans S7.3]EGO28820.1 hypothetical protein SERLADRAFT_459650 [Serpula lacrymans var. lacrymans S7.9]